MKRRIWNGQSHVRPSALPTPSSSLQINHHERIASDETDFSKTLFTPSGIDIYIRSSPSGSTKPTTEQRQELLEKVIAAVQGCKVGEVGGLAKKGFQVPGVV
jgi:hypothetical protein